MVFGKGQTWQGTITFKFDDSALFAWNLINGTVLPTGSGTETTGGRICAAFSTALFVPGLLSPI